MSPATIFLTSRPRLRPVAALLRRVCLALAQVGGPGPSAARHRYSTQLPLLRARVHPSWRGWPQPARGLGHVRRLRHVRDWIAGNAGAPHDQDTSAILGAHPRLQCRRGGRHHCRLLLRHSARPCRAVRRVGCSVLDPDTLPAHAGYHSRRCILFAGASSAQDGRWFAADAELIAADHCVAGGII
jgi:hypothetical protein